MSFITAVFMAALYMMINIVKFCFCSVFNLVCGFLGKDDPPKIWGGTTLK